MYKLYRVLKLSSTLSYSRFLVPGLLALVDFVTKAESHSLAFGSDSDVASHRRLGLGRVLLQAHVGQGVLAEY